ncbi:MAG: amidohydrolase [Bacteroidetes bacterium]|jgi:5-methylthioadenosine/S-adenosylhomocysteine deaminase|nr:amidohydrolase [Bacteroidota bacterium]MBT3751286.1 amidohydrolase [Bacteroidota bacterium]MBT4411001.1 amidohydrolase [Bacteroidota bacterium]MBT7092226.1 amidohydrolase [Bacteroidota bacterium]MBT7465618.1 amidohydrolase [Bacteroidota bacterium]
MNPIIEKYDIHIQHAWVLCLDSDFTEYRDSSILIKDGKIAYIGECLTLEPGQASENIDGSRKLVIPPFFNGHSHIAMSLFRGFRNDVPLKTWLEDYIWPAEQKYINPDNVYLGSMVSGIEMIRAGCNIFADMYFYEESVAQAAEELGIRAIIGEAILSFPTPNKKTPADGLRYTEILHKTYFDHDLISLSIPAHAPYTCSLEILEDISALAKELSIPTAIHLSETSSEVEESIDKFGLTPPQYIAQSGFLDDHCICHHCNFLSDEDMKLLRKKGASVISMPNSNMLLASGIAPVKEMLDTGLVVGVGTDGAASNNNQSVLNDLQQLVRLQKVKHQDPTAISARHALSIGTINGAKAYRMDKLLGSLEEGKAADMIIIDTDKPHMQPIFDPYAQIIYSMQESDIESLIINGRFIMRERVIISFDEERLLARATRFSKNLK